MTTALSSAGIWSVWSGESGQAAARFRGSGRRLAHRPLFCPALTEMTRLEKIRVTGAINGKRGHPFWPEGATLRSAREWLLPDGPVSASAGWRRTGRNSAPRRQRRSHRDDGCDQADQGRILRLCELPPGESDTQG